MNISNINLRTVNNLFLEGTGPQDAKPTKGFADYLNDAVEKTNHMILEADNIGNQFALGETDDIHRVLIAAEKADIALQFTLQVRNKIIDAYNEIMRMQI